MARDKNQSLMFNIAELSLIKAVFADNEELIYAIRKLILQFPMTDAEKIMVRTAMTPEVYAVIKKRMFPEITGDEPLSQMSDFYQSLNNDLNTKSEDEMESLFEVKQLQIDYLAQQFQILGGVEVEEKLKLEDMKAIDLKDSHKTYVNTKARNFLLAYVDQMLSLIKSIASQKDETPEQTAKRLTRDSTK